MTQITVAMSSAENSSPKQPSIKPAGTKRDSRPPEPTGESSDSSRSRSLSAGRTSSRRVEGSKKLGEAQSKWNLSHESWKEVFVYDECSESLENLPASHTLFLVMNALVEDHREPIMLLGGLRDFQVIQM